MKKNIEPLKIDVLSVNAGTLKVLGEIKVPDIHVPSTNNFHPDGLYSTNIFGSVGSPERIKRYGYINLKLPILHPVVFDLLSKAVSLYGKILEGTTYAKYVRKTNTFVEQPFGSGDTGYEFFISHINTLTVEDTGSSSRNTLIGYLKKHKNNLTITKLIVLPAGLRDYNIDKSGKPSEDEINTYYRKILNGSNFIPENVTGTSTLDPIRYNMQKALAELYDYVKSILYGKRGFINKRVIDRRIHGATRNVITAMQYPTPDIRDPRFIADDTCLAGLYQMLKATQHQMTNAVRTFIEPIMPGDDIDFNMIDPKTYRKVTVKFSPKSYRTMTSYDGVNKLCDSLQSNVTNVPLMYGKYYYALLYVDDNEYIVLHDINDLPDGKESTKVQPIGLIDLFYISCNQYLDKTVGTVTRYPVLNHGSIFATKFELKTTALGTIKYEIDKNGERTGIRCLRWPDYNSNLFKSVNVNGDKLDALGADFDGDTVTLTIAYSDEAVSEILNDLDDPKHWIGVDDRMLYSSNNDYTRMVMSVLTGNVDTHEYTYDRK